MDKVVVQGGWWLNRIRIRFGKTLLEQFYNVYIAKEGDDGVSHIGEPVRMVPYEDYHTNPPPTLELSPDALQYIMNDLWNMGFRPTNEVGTSGHLGAMKEHIKDLRFVIERMFDKEVPIER